MGFVQVRRPATPNLFDHLPFEEPEVGPISQPTLATSVIIGLATAGSLAWAGAVVRTRRPPPQDRLALQAFVIWWYSASLVILVPTIRTVLAVLGVRDIALYSALAYAQNLPLALALGSLLYYILYLLTGRRNLLGPVAIVYTLYFAYLVWYAVTSGERTLEVRDWGVQLQGDTPHSAAATVVFGVVLAAPVLITVVAYATLFFRVRDPVPRYRLGMISGAFLGLFGIILASFLLGWNGKPWFPLTYQLPALAASLIVVMAFRPPSWIGRRLGIPDGHEIPGH